MRGFLNWPAVYLVARFRPHWSQHNGLQRLPQNLAVQPKGLFSHILQTESHFLRMNFFKVVLIWICAASQNFSLIAKTYRGIVGDARPRIQDDPFFLCVQFYGPEDLRSWPN